MTREGVAAVSYTGDFGFDGTQDPPPPRLFADPLGGLVTGEAYAPPKPVEPLSFAVQPLPPAPDPEIARKAIRAAFAQEQRPRQRTAPGPATRSYSARQQQYRAPVVQGPAAVAPAAAPKAEPKRGSALGGCLIGLVIAGSLLFSVLRPVFEAILDIFR